MYRIVKSEQELSKLCQDILKRQPKLLGVDTEFMRDKTHFYPEIYYIQLYYSNKAYIIDIKSLQDHLQPLKTVLTTPSITKIFHGCTQDLNGIYHLLGAVPSPIFDTQIAHSLVNYSHQCISYEDLVMELFDTQITNDKKYIKWNHKNISKKQMQYAANDVIYLEKIYNLLQPKLVQYHRTSWLQEELAELLDSAGFPNIFSTCKKIANYSAGPDEQKVKIFQLVTWRENIAKSQNIHRQLILSDKSICQIVTATTTIEKTLKYNKEECSLEHIREIEDMLAAEVGPETQIDSIKTPDNSHNKDCNDFALDKQITAIINTICQKNDISPHIVMTSYQQREIMHKIKTNTLSGWRSNLLCELLSFFAGKSKLNVNYCMQNNQVVMDYQVTDNKGSHFWIDKIMSVIYSLVSFKWFPMGNIVGESTKLFALSSVLALLFAYTMQYAFHMAPCEFCSYQRVPFFAVILLTICSSFVTISDPDRWRRTAQIITVICYVLFGINIVIASIHVGIEKQVITIDTACMDTPSMSGSLGVPTPRCDTPAFVFLGLSMAGWNVLYCLSTIFAVMIIGVIRCRQLQRKSQNTNNLTS